MCIIPVYVKFPNLPLEYWSKIPLSRIAGRVGVPITADQLTKEKWRYSYARVLIHVDASQELVRSFRVINPDGSDYIQVVYEFEPRYCNKCNSLKNKIEACQHAHPRTKVTGLNKPKETGKNMQHANVKGKNTVPHAPNPATPNKLPHTHSKVDHGQDVQGAENEAERHKGDLANKGKDLLIHDQSKDTQVMNEIDGMSQSGESSDPLTDGDDNETTHSNPPLDDVFQVVTTRRKRRRRRGKLHSSPQPSTDNSLTIIESRRGLDPPTLQ